MPRCSSYVQRGWESGRLGVRRAAGGGGGGDQASVEGGAFRLEVDVVVVEQVGLAVARRVPVDEHGVGVPAGHAGEQCIVRRFPNRYLEEFLLELEN